ncbi:RDD family protein [Bacillus sp. EAC]|uniref:RDD family protein n=1 Tax=Bacillus sp. EAC TaxID=1978338 RepID=UPI000B4430A4|nr:RDD family protein [Bacillus sp. EAC]
MNNEEHFVASFGSRLTAGVIDILILFIPLCIVFLMINGNLFFNNWESFLLNICLIIYLTITPLFWGGKTVGKSFEKIKIVDKNKESLNLFRMFLREFIGKYILATITFGISTIISALMIHYRRDKRAIHDFIAGTYVTEYY